MSTETQLNAPEGNVAGRGGKGGIGDIGGIGGKGGIPPILATFPSEAFN